LLDLLGAFEDVEISPVLSATIGEKSPIWLLTWGFSAQRHRLCGVSPLLIAEQAHVQNDVTAYDAIPILLPGGRVGDLWHRDDADTGRPDLIRAPRTWSAGYAVCWRS
jgi:hypothetical protein